VAPVHQRARVLPFWPHSVRISERLGIEAEFAAELLAGFIERVRGERTEWLEMHERLSSGAQEPAHFEWLRFRMHRLRGTCAVLGFCFIGREAARVEAHARLALQAPEHHAPKVLISLAVLIDLVGLVL
jgi:hypothetical protein